MSDFLNGIKTVATKALQSDFDAAKKSEIKSSSDVHNFTQQEVDSAKKYQVADENLNLATLVEDNAKNKAKEIHESISGLKKQSVEIERMINAADDVDSGKIKQKLEDLKRQVEEKEAELEQVKKTLSEVDVQAAKEALDKVKVEIKTIETKLTEAEKTNQKDNEKVETAKAALADNETHEERLERYKNRLVEIITDKIKNNDDLQSSRCAMFVREATDEVVAEVAAELGITDKSQLESLKLQIHGSAQEYVESFDKHPWFERVDVSREDLSKLDASYVVIVKGDGSQTAFGQNGHMFIPSGDGGEYSDRTGTMGRVKPLGSEYVVFKFNPPKPEKPEEDETVSAKPVPDIPEDNGVRDKGGTDSTPEARSYDKSNYTFWAQTIDSERYKPDGNGIPGAYIRNIPKSVAAFMSNTNDLNGARNKNNDEKPSIDDLGKIVQQTQGKVIKKSELEKELKLVDTQIRKSGYEPDVLMYMADEDPKGFNNVIARDISLRPNIIKYNAITDILSRMGDNYNELDLDKLRQMLVDKDADFNKAFS